VTRSRRSAARDWWLSAAVLVAAVLSACATAQNYPDPAGPRYHGEFAAQPAPATIKVVTLNLKYSKHTATAVQLLMQ
jgi:hypothetical protein